MSIRNMEAEADSLNITMERLLVYVSNIMEPYADLISFKSLLLWERPYLSAGTLGVLSCIFWTIALTSARLYTSLALVTVIGFLFYTWITQRPVRNVHYDDVQEKSKWCEVNVQLYQYVSDFWINILNGMKIVWELREREHNEFCKLLCSTLFVLAVLGHILPGPLVVYLLAMAFSGGPALLYYLNEAKHYQCDMTISSESLIRKFSPDISSSNKVTAQEMAQSCDSTHVYKLKKEEFYSDKMCKSDTDTIYHDWTNMELLASERETSMEDSSNINDSKEIQFVTTHFKIFPEESEYHQCIDSDTNLEGNESSLSTNKSQCSLSTHVPGTGISSSTSDTEPVTASSNQLNLSRQSSYSDFDISEYDIISENEISFS